MYCRNRRASAQRKVRRHMRDCTDAPGWRSYLGHNCRAYHERKWCHGGRLLNSSAGGALLGSPEHACCACGGPKPTTPLRQAIFFATHTLDDVDERLLRHYSRELAAVPTVGLFTLLFRSEAAAPLAAGELATWDARSKRSGVDLWLWDEPGLRQLFPNLELALHRSAAHKSTPKAVANYFFFHCSLLLWNATFGHLHPSIEYYWRMEPDALFAGSLSRMVELAAPVRVDVLLPHIEPQSNWAAWPHWSRNSELIANTPADKRFMSLVSFGRYSAHFLRSIMAREWTAGKVGYEEITLPTTCATSSSPCSMESFWRHCKIKSAKRCVFRPVWNCSSFLKARQQETAELWHPVKDRRCVVEWLDGRGGVL